MLLVATLIITPFAIPFLLQLLGTGATPTPWDVAWPMLVFVAVPLVLGVVARALYPEFVAEVGPWLGPLSVTFLLVHILLFLGYTWSDFLSLAGNGQLAFILVFPLAGMLIGYLLSPPYVLSPLPAAHPQRATKVVSAVAVAEQNTCAVICTAIFPLGAFTVAGDYLLVGALLTIVVVLVIALELGKRAARAVPAAAAAPAASPAPAPSQG
jgi:BASS family bile acid:Na+ symporter